MRLLQILLSQQRRVGNRNRFPTPFLSDILNSDMVKLLYDSTKNKDMRYAVRADIMDPFFFLDTGESRYVFLDHREFGLFEEQNHNPFLKAILLKPPFLPAKELAFKLIESYGLRHERIEVSSTFPVALADFLREKGIFLAPALQIFPEREQKTPEEIQAIRKSIRSTEKAFVLIESILGASKIQGKYLSYQGATLTSEFLKKEIERLFLEEGMVNEEGIIISTGLQTAIPHHMGSGAVLANEPIVCDIFPKNKDTGYFSDLTRTFVKGNPSAQISSMIDAIVKAQSLAIEAIRPGVHARDIHKVCSGSLKKSEFDVGEKGFTHGTGHGVGLEVHESPFVGASSASVLQQGNVITIEPGLYYDGTGGVRMEDMALITPQGVEMLSSYPKNWLIP